MMRRAATAQWLQCAQHTPATGGEEERHRDNHVECAHHTPATGGEERKSIEPIKWMRSPHTSYRWRGESHRANQVYALTTHQLQVERREEERIDCHRANQVMRSPPPPATRWRGESDHRSHSSVCSPHTSYRWRGERDHRANQVDAFTTHQLQVERREKS